MPLKPRTIVTSLSALVSPQNPATSQVPQTNHQPVPPPPHHPRSLRPPPQRLPLPPPPQHPRRSVHRPPAPRRRRPRNDNIPPRHREPRLHHQTSPLPPIIINNHHKQQTPPLPNPRHPNPPHHPRRSPNLRDRPRNPRRHIPASSGMRAAREVARYVPREGFAGYPRDSGGAAVLWVWVYERYGVAVSGAGARGGGVCGEGGGGGGEVFGGVEGGGEEGWVDVGCCAGGGVCLGGEFYLFFFLNSFDGETVVSFGSMGDVLFFCVCYIFGYLDANDTLQCLLLALPTSGSRSWLPSGIQLPGDGEQNGHRRIGFRDAEETGEEDSVFDEVRRLNNDSQLASTVEGSRTRPSALLPRDNTWASDP